MYSAIRTISMWLSVSCLTACAVLPATSTPGSRTTETSSATPLPAERDALVALYEATDGEDWRENDRWLSGLELFWWYGIEVGKDGVIGIELGANGLNGAIPPEIGLLTSLHSLYLTDNHITSIPPEIGQLTKLEFLLLGQNELTTLPPEVGQLSNLHTLWLDDNQLTSLPAGIGQLNNLGMLTAEHNRLTDLPPEIGQLTNLDILYLNDNQLTGLPVEIGQLGNLKILVLNNNQLTSLPSEIGHLSNLEELLLKGNPLTGPLPEWLMDLDSLHRLDVSGTELCLPQTDTFLAWYDQQALSFNGEIVPCNDG